MTTWQRARNVGGAVGFVFWVEVGPPKDIEGANEFDPLEVSDATAYRTNLLGLDGSQLYANAATVELTPEFTDAAPLVDLRSELVAQGFTETGIRP